MAGALAEREWADPPRRQREEERRSLTVVKRGSRRRRGLRLRHNTSFWLVAFAIAIALLAVGRVTLSFAVVQKNMETQALVTEQRKLRTENVQLQEELASVTATPRLRQLAMERYGLVPAENVVFLDGVQAASTGAAEKTATAAGSGGATASLSGAQGASAAGSTADGDGGQ